MCFSYTKVSGKSDKLTTAYTFVVEGSSLASREGWRP